MSPSKRLVSSLVSGVPPAALPRFLFGARYLELDDVVNVRFAHVMLRVAISARVYARKFST